MSIHIPSHFFLIYTKDENNAQLITAPTESSILNMICQCVAHILSLPCQIGEKGTMIACPPKLVFHSKQAVLWMTCHPHPPCEHLWGGLYLIPGDQGIPGKNRYILLSYSLSFLMNTCEVAYFLLGFPGRKGKNAQRDDYTFFHPKHTLWMCETFLPPSLTNTCGRLLPIRSKR